MAKANILKQLMQTPLPSISVQKRKPYRPTKREAKSIYKILNKHCFDNQLSRPKLILKPRLRNYWGQCVGYYTETKPGTKCEIELSDKWFCLQWFITTLAHEMCHQYEHDILQRPMTHRQNFFIHRDRLAKYGIDLKTAHGQRRWFKYQNFKKC